MEPNIAFRDYSRLLNRLSGSALPLAIRGTMNSIAFETRTRIVEKEMPRQFIIRNKFEQKAVRFKYCKNTFRIEEMQSSAGQLMTVKFSSGSKNFRDLRQQELGSTKGPRKGSKRVRIATDNARIGKSHGRVVAKRNRSTKAKSWLKMEDIEALRGIYRGRLSHASRIGRAHAIMIKRNDKDQIYMVPFKNRPTRVGVFRVVNGKPMLLHYISPKPTKLKVRKTVKPAYLNIMGKRSPEIWEEQVGKRIKAEADKYLRSLRV